MSNKLNRLVAERVMGWKLSAYEDGRPAITEADYADAAINDGWSWSGFDEEAHMWQPSTNIVDAWQIVEEDTKRWYGISYSAFCENGMEHERCSVAVHLNGELETVAYANASTAELAITLAALRACGVSEAEIQEAMQP